MSPRTAIWEGLRDSFRFGGTMRRAPYLWFLAAATCAFAEGMARTVWAFRAGLPAAIPVAFADRAGGAMTGGLR